MAESILRETIIKVLNKGYDIEAGSQDKFNNLVKNLELAISEKFIPYKKEIDLGFCKVSIDEKVKSISIISRKKVHGEYSVPGFKITMIDGKIIVSNHPDVYVVDSNGSFHSCVAKVTGCVLEVFENNRIIPVVDKEQVVGDSIADDTDAVQNCVKIQNGKMYKVEFDSNTTIVEASKLPEIITYYLTQKKDITITPVGMIANYDPRSVAELLKWIL